MKFIDTSWSVYNQADTATAWGILTALETDTAWSTFSQADLDTAWRILLASVRTFTARPRAYTFTARSK
jgi:hypothetical protein